MNLKGILSAVVIIAILTIGCVAVGSSGNVYTSANGNITVLFEENSVLPVEKQKNIADDIINQLIGISSTDDNGIEPASIMCSLLGHNLKTDTMYAVEHKVYISQPRCVKTTYTIKTCTRCDYQDIEEVGKTYIYCCPTD